MSYCNRLISMTTTVIFIHPLSVLSLNCEIEKIRGIQPLSKYFSMFILILISHYFPINKFNIMTCKVCIIRLCNRMKLDFADSVIAKEWLFPGIPW